MRVGVRKDLCMGAGMCALTAPEVFTQSEDDGTVEILDPHPSQDRHALVRRAVTLCPAGAITVTEDAER
ncbi:ferredoxin [Streptomyces sp. NBS 14/10]|uniref:ferredoxin n=1 Tax=Streptomyces sp. NBS 14/10 TaxID=1945643 RepID=UPI000B7CC48E|nr:ferredoxin [Streptomyces sp. NBS 14/10]KAK1178071.1 ferredoxin [Streptomyces sp. NBS 14/10]NUS86461.1 ferredoxin [Streptomyces sp.]